MRFRHILLGAVFTLSATAALAEPSAEELARLEQMSAEADSVDAAGDPAASRAAWQSVLDYAGTLYPAGHPRLASIESELSLALYFEDDVPGATDLLERMITILAAGGPDYLPDVIDNQNALVVFYMKSGRQAEALAMAQRVLDQRREQYAADPANKTAIKELGAALNNLANAENEIGNYDRAVELSRESTHYADLMEGTLPNAAVWYANYPLYLERAGRLDEALSAARDTIQIVDGLLPEGHPYRGNILNTFAGMATERGLYGEAEAASRKAVGIAAEALGEDNHQTAGYKTMLGQIYLRTQRPQQALDLVRGAIPPLEANLGPNADLVLLAHQIEAEALLQTGQIDAAHAVALDIWDKRQEVSHPGHRERIASGELLAQIEYALGNAEQAYQLYAGLQEARRAIFPDNNLERLAGEVRLGFLSGEAGIGDYGDALDAADLLWRVAGQQGQLDPLAGREFVAVSTAYAIAAEAALAGGDAPRIFTAAQRVLRTAADDAVRSASDRQNLSSEQRGSLRESQNRERERVRLNRAYLRAVGASADPAILAGLSDQLAALGPSAPVALAAGNEGAAALASLSDIQASLEADEAILLTVPLPQRLLAMVIRADGTMVSSVAISSDEVGAQIADLRHAMGVGDALSRGVLVRSQSAPAYDFAPGAGLYQLIFGGEVEDALAGTERLSIAAGGALSRIPFSVLAPAPASGRLEDSDWLIRRFGLSTLASFSGFGAAAPAAAPANSERVVAIGAPRLGGTGISALRAANGLPDDASIDDLPPLPAAQEELDAIARVFASAKSVLLTGEEAQEARVLAELAQPANVIAFATHGLLEGDISGLDEPALVLTPDDGDDGLLTASEVAALDMDADWVILSACNTGGPDRPSAAGLSGLASAFLFAGARNLLVSHWEVADDVARSLTVPTVELYYRDGVDPAEGLRRAVIDLIDNSSDPRLRHPAYWGPFVYVGGS